MMTTIARLLALVLLVCWTAPLASGRSTQAPLEARSPSGRVSLTFALDADGAPTYSLMLGTRQVVRSSRLGLELKDTPPLTSGFVVERSETKDVDDTWDPVWGEQKTIRDHHRELAVTLRQPNSGNQTLVIRFRVFDDGLALPVRAARATDAAERGRQRRAYGVQSDRRSHDLVDPGRLRFERAEVSQHATERGRVDRPGAGIGDRRSEQDRCELRPDAADDEDRRSPLHQHP